MIRLREGLVFLSVNLASWQALVENRSRLIVSMSIVGPPRTSAHECADRSFRRPTPEGTIPIHIRANLAELPVAAVSRTPS